GANHVGWQNPIHGGIVYSALDDVTANVIYLQGRKAHTAKCEIRYRQPLYVGETIKLTGWIEKEKGRLIILKGEARRKTDDVLVADCEASFMVFN
ncbi:MAG TPA: hotdog fold domain-containing protein, partial [Woeseiaceae bacterium]|nr:hotdog fold domain-containing protein [Woeseiaceae bacterium]